jgi:hypothetical protein
MYDEEYTPEYNNPLIKAFIAKFGGEFGIDAGSCVVGYIDKNEEPHNVFKNKTQFFDLLSQSIKQNKNLLLQIPYEPDMPEMGI